MVQMMQPGQLCFSVFVYSMQEEILSQHLSHRKCGHFKISDFFEYPVRKMSQKENSNTLHEFPSLHTTPVCRFNISD